MIGGSGPKVTLRLVAEYAQLWNGMGDPETFRQKVEILDEWCAKVGRDPKEIDRTVMIGNDRIDDVDAYLEAGATHVILGVDAPFDLDPLKRLLELSRG